MASTSSPSSYNDLHHLPPNDATAEDFIVAIHNETKSKILYVQMKGRGTRKCEEAAKDFYKLVDFIDISRLEDTG